MKNSLLLLALGALSIPAFAQTATAPKPAAPTAEKKVVKSSGQTSLRFLHALPGGPSVDILVDGAKVSTALGYKKISAYMPAKSGRRKIQVVATGTSTPILIEEPKTFAADKSFTVAIHGTKSAPKLLFITDSSKMAEGRTKVRATHLVFGGPTVLLTTPSTRAEAGFAKFLAQPLAFGETKSKTFKPTANKLQIRTPEGKLLKESAELKFDANQQLGIYVLGEANGTGDNALDIVSAPIK